MKNEKINLVKFENVNTTMAELPIDKLSFGAYQREVKTLKKMKKNFNEVLSKSPIMVSFRDGKYYVLDGQHRVLMAKERSQSHILSIIFFNLTEEAEAMIFRIQTDAIEKLSCNSKFHADLTRKLPYAVNLKKILDKYGLTIEKENGKTHVSGKAVLLKEAMLRNDCKSIEFVFSFMKQNMWLNKTDKACYESFILDGLIYAYNTFEEDSINLGSILKENLNMSSKTFKKKILVEYSDFEKRQAVKEYMNIIIRK